MHLLCQASDWVFQGRTSENEKKKRGKRERTGGREEERATKKQIVHMFYVIGICMWVLFMQYSMRTMQQKQVASWQPNKHGL